MSSCRMYWSDVRPHFKKYFTLHTHTHTHTHASLRRKEKGGPHDTARWRTHTTRLRCQHRRVPLGFKEWWVSHTQPLQGCIQDLEKGGPCVAHKNIILYCLLIFIIIITSQPLSYVNSRLDSQNVLPPPCSTYIICQ